MSNRLPHFRLPDPRLKRRGSGSLKGDTNGALSLFNLNAEEYPNSGNVHDSLGEAYMKAGNKSAAIKHYEKSLNLDPKNTWGTEMLKYLQYGDTVDVLTSPYRSAILIAL